MKKKQQLMILLPVIVALLAGLIALSAATYAWFTFDPYTNVTPLEGKISKGEANLLISESKDGPFDKQCTLNPAVFSQELRPVSTVDLNRFYTSIAQNRNGYSVAFQEVTDKTDQYLIHGTVYLQCLGGQLRRLLPNAGFGDQRRRSGTLRRAAGNENHQQKRQADHPGV